MQKAQHKNGPMMHSILALSSPLVNEIVEWSVARTMSEQFFIQCYFKSHSSPRAWYPVHFPTYLFIMVKLLKFHG